MAPSPSEREIQPGDSVRSYDFPGNDTCYVEGVVACITRPLQGCPRYEIDVLRRVWDGNEIPVPEEEKKVYPPVNNTPTALGGVTQGVVLAGQPAKPVLRPR